MKHFFLRILTFFLAMTFLFALPSCGEREDAVLTKLTYPVGAEMPLASDFVLSAPEGATFRFARTYSFPNTGTYSVEIIMTDARGRETTYSTSFSLVLDIIPPVLQGVKDLSVAIGEGVSYRAGVTVTDNCAGETVLSVDTSRVDLKKPGTYPVTYRAVDVSGNVTERTVTLYVYERSVSLEELNAMIDAQISTLGLSSMGREAQIRKIYEYVSAITYTATSDKSSWIRAAYEGMRTNSGDCYTYFALSKAFFERLGIQSMDIERTPGIVDERHYWNYVNLGSAEAPSWYHFDACPVSDKRRASGCLLTDAQVGAYTRIRDFGNGVTGYFYAYNASGYPASATAILTPIPALEPYL